MFFLFLQFYVRDVKIHYLHAYIILLKKSLEQVLLSNRLPFILRLRFYCVIFTFSIFHSHFLLFRS